MYLGWYINKLGSKWQVFSLKNDKYSFNLFTVKGNPPAVEIGLVEPGASPDLHSVVLVVLPVDGRLDAILDADVVP
jgi:hypothetical protein